MPLRFVLLNVDNVHIRLHKTCNYFKKIYTNFDNQIFRHVYTQ